MTVGKPNFNLNSFGVKYLSKDEVQEFLEKETKVYNYEPPTGQDQAALRTERAKKPKGTLQASESAKKLISEVKPAEATPKPKVTNNTEYVFNDPRYGVPDTRKPQTTGHGESGIVPPNTTALDTRTSRALASANTGNAPKELKGDDIRPSKQSNRTVSVGVGQKGKEVFDKKEGEGEKYEKQYDSKGKKISAKARKEKLQKETEAKEKREKETKLNQALQKLEREKQQKKKIPQKTGKGDKSQDTDDYNPEGDTESTIETESEESFKKRSRENERKRQADAAKKKKKKITDKERMTNIVEGYRAERGLGKSNDIITKMNIMKLDLIKSALNRNNPSKNSLPVLPEKEEQQFQEQSTTARMGKLHDGVDYEDTPKTGSSPKGTGGSLQTSDTWQGGQEDSEYRKITNPLYTNDGKGKYDVQSSPSRKRGTPKVDPRMRKKDPIKTIPKTASETIFKAISLKLDLTTLK